jgi:hypothetical protein
VTILLTCMVVLMVGFTGWWCYRLGFASGVRHAAERYDWLTSVEPTKRTQGVPTNVYGATASVRRARIKQGRMRGGPDPQ